MTAGERAACKSLADALAECMANLDQIQPGERVRTAMFGEYAQDVGGGYYWMLDLESLRTIGTRETRAQNRRNFAIEGVKAENMKIIVQAYAEALSYEAQRKGNGEL